MKSPIIMMLCLFLHLFALIFISDVSASGASDGSDEFRRTGRKRSFRKRISQYDDQDEGAKRSRPDAHPQPHENINNIDNNNINNINNDYKAPQEEPGNAAGAAAVEEERRQPHPNNGFPYCSASMKNTDFRSLANEDRDFAFISKFRNENVYVHGVADGFGGPFVSNYLKSFFPALLTISLNHITTFPSPEVELSDSHLNQFSDRIVKALHLVDWYLCKNHLMHETGATTSFVVRFRNYAFILNLGNTKTMVISGDGRMLYSTTDHIIANPFEKLRVEVNGGFTSIQDNYRTNALLFTSRGLGNCRFKVMGRDNLLNPSSTCENYVFNGIYSAIPDVHFIRLDTGKKYAFLSATDGVSSAVHLEQLPLIRHHLNHGITDICDNIVTRVRSTDDKTIIIVTVGY